MFCSFVVLLVVVLCLKVLLFVVCVCFVGCCLGGLFRCFVYRCCFGLMVCVWFWGGGLDFLDCWWRLPKTVDGFWRKQGGLGFLGYLVAYPPDQSYSCGDSEDDQYPDQYGDH